MRFYCITNVLDGRKYIGSTIRELSARFAQHCVASTAIGKDIQRLGVKAFTIELLEENDDMDDRDREAVLMREMNTFWPRGYNVHRMATRGDRIQREKESAEYWYHEAMLREKWSAEFSDDLPVWGNPKNEREVRNIVASALFDLRQYRNALDVFAAADGESVYDFIMGAIEM